MLSEVLAAMAGKVASAGIATKISVGAVAAVVGVSSAAAADVLPEGSQDAVASVIEAATPFDVPDSGDVVDESALLTDGPVEPAEPASEPTDSSTTEDDAAGDAAEPTDAATEEMPKETFGTVVSEDARDGGVDGQEISSAARAAHQPAHAQGPARSAEPPASVVEDPADAPSDPADTAAVPLTTSNPPTSETVAPAPAEPLQPGNGGGRGQGKGNR